MLIDAGFRIQFYVFNQDVITGILLQCGRTICIEEDIKQLFLINFLLYVEGNLNFRTELVQQSPPHLM